MGNSMALEENKKIDSIDDANLKHDKENEYSESDFVFIEKPVEEDKIYVEDFAIEPEPEEVKDLNFIEVNKIQTALARIFDRNPTNTEIYDWITVTFGKKTKDPLFIHALTLALIGSLMAKSSDDGSLLVFGDTFKNNLKNRSMILNHCLRNADLETEMIVILGIQQLSAENQHPPGFVKACVSAFYELEVLSDDIFEEWEKSDDPECEFGRDPTLSDAKRFLHWYRGYDN